ncbi:hypothetical protein GWK47_054309 [Chionoecetes opilio]|uniref:Uncharacterized protein n=1 Tax=Chionoecetes opilio TaxID=41210 RepID=A0A8J4Y753_CHIOP|nr:hypothetical protein GWK47_054309 [Chionoecetes opilio]
MDSCGGCGSGGEGEQLPPTAPTLTQASREQDRTRIAAEKLLTDCTHEELAEAPDPGLSEGRPRETAVAVLPVRAGSVAAGDQWSQEENSEEAAGRTGPLPITNGVGGGDGINGLHLGREGTAAHSLLNNNLVEEKCNLRRADDKTLCLYHKFPAKVNNNVYPERGVQAGDGMDEYFRSHRGAPSQPPAQPPTRRNELSPGREHLNLLNGEEEDEDDGCIYTYKGESLEANLSHLIDMCLSCGLPNPERAAAARPRPPGPSASPHNNLFSPDMDFLEMDFDPGPGGDGDADSDCEDNCLHECDSRLGQGGAAHKATNYCPDMLSLMCRRCESSLCDGKIDNVALNLSVAPSPPAPALNIGRGPSAGLDHRPGGAEGGLNVPRGGLNLPQDLNVGLNQLCGGHGQGRLGSGEEEEEEDAPDNDSVENNLAEADLLDIMDHLSDDADDEDDSNSEKYEPRRLAGSRAGCGGGRCRRASPRDLSRMPHKAANNNLGSVSAPEVSPAREYSPLEKFGRSLSFHNQLSSPKYENVCFVPRPRRDERPAHRPAEDPASPLADSANLAACSGRLHRRENSVFNILSDSTPSQSGNCSPQGPANGSVVEMNGGPTGAPSCTSTTTTTSIASSAAASQIPALRHINPLLKAPPDTGSPASRAMKGVTSGQPWHLPIKSLRPKNTNPSQDPNTASEGEGGGEDSCPRVKKVMIWTELQASARQVTQIATSACGATAVINVLVSHNSPWTTRSLWMEVKGSIRTRLRAEAAALVDYLLSRAVAGTTHRDLVQGVTQLSQGAIKAKFFHMFPKRAVQLSRWLAQWISKGGVPVATLNLQVGVAPGQTIPDAWHHQMIFGVGPQGVYLTNPLECVSDCMLGDQLCTDSTLLVRRADVVSRWGSGDKLVRLTRQEDPRWRDMNVLGQVVGVLKEQAAPPVVQGRRHLTSHVAIPAAYKSGVTIFMRSDNLQLPTLMQAEDLPLLE